MLSIGPIRSTQDNYYLLLAQEDYYLNGGEPPGIWHGKGARTLSLMGIVQEKAYRNLFRGFSPDGERKLVKNAGRENHRAGLDLTFSMPKSASILWGVSPHSEGREIRKAGLEATKKALSFVEEYALLRRGKGGETKESAGIIAAIWEHGTSRAQDPNLHFHATVMNAGVREEDGKTWSLETKTFFELKMATGAIFRAEAAHQLKKRLGLKLIRKRSWFEVEGVPEELIEQFSTRRKEILEALGIKGFNLEHGTVVDAKAAATEVLHTRTKKECVARELLHKIWVDTCRELGYDPKSLGTEIEPYIEDKARDKRLLQSFIAELTQWEPGDFEPGQKEASAEKEKAIKSLLLQESSFTEGALIRRVAEEAQVHGISADTILETVREFLDSDQAILLEKEGQGIYTVPEVLAVEEEVVETAVGLSTTTTHQIEAKAVDAIVTAIADKVRRKSPDIPRETRVGLSEEQEKALRHITQDPGSVKVIVGHAGAGKTFMLDAARRAWEKKGYEVIGAAVSAKAARGLKDGAALSRSTSIAKLLMDLKKGQSLGSQVTEAVTKTLLSAVAPQKKSPKVRLTSRTVLVIDEAGMVGTRQLQLLLREVKRAGAKLVLVGDDVQLQPIDAGGPFAALKKKLGAASLSQNWRQKEDWARQAVLDFREGKTERALRAYQSRGLLSVTGTRQKAIDALIADWGLHLGRRPQDHLIIAGMRSEVDALNQRAQQHRLMSLALGLGHLRINGSRFHVGDRVLFTQNSAKNEIFNGDLGTVRKVDPMKRTLTVKLDSGNSVVIDPKKYSGIELGYAITSHKAQGVTIEKNTYVLAGGHMQDLHLTYVQATRAKQETKFFIDRKSYKSLSRDAGRKNEKKLAMTIQEEAQARERAAQKLAAARKQSVELSR